MNKRELVLFEQDKLEWRQFCETEPSVTIYQQPWYWDAVCDHPDDWRVILIKKNGAIEAAFPFVYRRHHFIWYIETPWQMPASGIWMRKRREDFRSIEADFVYLKEIVDAVVERLPYFDSFQVGFNSRLWSWQPFYWHGFEATLHYTMIVSPKPIEQIKMQCSKSRRRRLNKAEREYQLSVDETSAEEFWAFFQKTYMERGMNISFSKEKFIYFFNMAKAHHALQIRSITDKDRVLAENIVLSDHGRFYHQFVAQFKDKDKDASALAVYDAICMAMREGKIFDFEGSMIPGVAQFNLSFNPEYENLYSISKETARFKVYSFFWKVKEFLFGKCLGRKHIE